MSVITSFVARRTRLSTILWSLFFAISSAATVIGIVEIFKSTQQIGKMIASFGNNAGMNLLFGTPYKLETIGGFTAWRSLGIVVLIAGIWGLLTATKIFRGDEDSGRWEMFLAGPTTRRQAVIHAIGGLGISLLIMFAINFVAIFGVGHSNGLSFGLAECLLYSVAVVAGAAIFMAVGLWASQLAPTRRKAAAISAILFGVFFLMRAVAAIGQDWRWLMNWTPLGWIEKIRPLTNNDATWLIPIGLFIVAFCAVSIYIAGKRDLGSSLLTDRDTARPRTKLLNSPIGLVVREDRGSIIGWLLGVSAMSALYGYLAKTATDVLNSSSETIKQLHGFGLQNKTFGVETYMAIVLLVIMVLVMVFVASLVNHIREDEAEGYLDNILVRPISRLRWLTGRVVVVIGSMLLAVVLGTVLGWLTAKSQNANMPFKDMMLAGVNILPPVLLIMGVGLLIFGLRPRLTSAVVYGIIAWSFLLEMIGPAIRLNHWILDTSLLHHVKMVPAVDPNWQSLWVIFVLSIATVVIGAMAFNGRDLASE